MGGVTVDVSVVYACYIECHMCAHASRNSIVRVRFGMTFSVLSRLYSQYQ